MEISEVFAAEPLSVMGFLSDTGLGIYIPPFQRSYRWEPQKIARLLDDIAHGLMVTTEMPDSICFLGTVIALRDTDYRTVEPIHREDVQSRVMSIIDGQQRLTTILILTTVLHEKISTLSRKLQNNESPLEKWAVDEAANLCASLQKLFIEDKNTGQGHYRFYPRMIRAYLDVWSRRDGMALYKSPIANYCFEYYKWSVAEDRGGVFTFSPLAEADTDEANAEAHRQFASKRDYVKRYVSKLVKGEGIEDTDGATVPSPAELAASESLQLALFNYGLNPTVTEAMLTQPNDESDLTRLIRLIELSNYMLLRVSVTVVTAKREEYAFDMFEALNTTGEPLTAIETFKPRAIAAEGLTTWKSCPSKELFDRVDAYLDREGGQTSDKRQRATNNLLIPFALAQTGKRLSKRLSEQRRYLKSTYDFNESEASSSLEDKRRYMKTMTNVAIFVEEYWGTNPALPKILDDDLRNDALLGLRILKDANHDIVVGPLARFFDAFVNSHDNDQSRMAEQLGEAVRATAGFFALWRGAFGGTRGIDDVWRSVAGGDVDRGFEGVARKARENSWVPNVAALRLYLHRRLSDEGVATEEQWVDKASMIGIYEASKHLTRLLLLAASDDSSLDMANPGLIVRGRAGLLPMLTLSAWESPDLRTIEHVVPQAESPGWDTNIYRTPNALHSLGNLTLLPGVANSSVSNSPWATKRVLYRALSAKTLDEAQILLAEAESMGVTLGQSAELIVGNAKYLPLLESISKVESSWDLELVTKRSRRIASLAYSRIAPWVIPQKA